MHWICLSQLPDLCLYFFGGESLMIILYFNNLELIIYISGIAHLPHHPDYS